MDFHLGLPTDHVGQLDDFVNAEAIAEMARAAEAAGFASVFVTEHPFPEDEWMRTGGHHALDPFVALSFAGAATSTVGLFTFLCVVPYRNPFLTAKAALSVDVLSGGRLLLGVGAGYLEPEFRALGVDFAERNELFDEGLVAIKRAWAEDGVVMTGRHFDAQGHTMLPHVASPPPILVGGNSKRAIRRAVDLADGWLPMPNPRAVGNRRRSAFLETVDELKAMLAYAEQYRAEQERERPFSVTAMPFVPSSPAMPGYDRARFLDHVDELAGLGVAGLAVGVPAPDRAVYLDGVAAFGADVIAALRG
jgi:probable F420-dependent oxidoreductase